NRYGTTIRARNFGGPNLPADGNTIRNSAFIRSQYQGVYTRGASNTLLENVTLFGSQSSDGFRADEDLTEPAPCSANPNGCSITARNTLSIRNAGAGASIETSVVNPWLIDSSNFFGNAGGNFPTSENISDGTGNIRNSRSTDPGAIGTGAGQCMLWIPDGSPMKGAGAGGADIGATILYRYQDGNLTTQPLWDPSTGA